MRNLIWSTFNDIKYKTYLVGILIEKYQKWDRNVNVFLALVSSTSIASWAIWKRYDFIWGFIIVVSQVLTVIKPYIPYFKYVKELNKRNQKLDSYCIDFEKLWYDFDNKVITEQEASRRYFSLKKAVSELLSFGDDVILSSSKKDVNKSNEKMKIFLKTNYNIDININPLNS